MNLSDKKMGYNVLFINRILDYQPVVQPSKPIHFDTKQIILIFSGKMESVLDISAHKYGNYHKYYTFHPSSTRSSFFSRDNILLQIWEGQGQPDVFSILDIGCNEGNLSMDVLSEAKRQLPDHVKCVLLGIDVDSSLIGLANNKYVTADSSCPITFETVNFMDETESKTFMKSYYDKLETKEWKFDGFNLVCLFSITMWIHLNYGDEGFLSFLERSADLLCPIGSLVVEPQPWKCYKSADKRCRKLGITRPLHYSALTIRDIEKETVDIVMGLSTTTTNSSTEVPVESTSVVKTRNPKQPAVHQPVPHRDISASMGMRSYWDLGKEGWGRSILIFHRSETLPTNTAMFSSSEAAPTATSTSTAALPTTDTTTTADTTTIVPTSTSTDSPAGKRTKKI